MQLSMLLFVWFSVVYSASGYYWVPKNPKDKKERPPFLNKPRIPKEIPDPNGDGREQPWTNSSKPLKPRAVTVFGGADYEPWPRRANGLRTVRYCYATPEMRETLREAFEAGIQIWACKLGAASAENGHSLAFHETTTNNGNSPRYCFNYFNKNVWMGHRNRHVPPDTLHIYAVEEAAYSTYGHRDIDATASSLVDEENQMMLYEGIDPGVVAHEIGHVLGLVHEQLRSDAAQHVEFRCHKVIGYADAISDAKEANPTMSEEEIKNKLCTDWDFANEYGFLATEYIRGSDADFRNEGIYDTLSIMQYASWIFQESDLCTPYTLDECPLVEIRMENGVRSGYLFIDEILKPSDKDIAFVKKWYPWQG